MTNKRKVNFRSSPSARIDYDDGLSQNERQEVCWYSEDELTQSRMDTKSAIQTLLSKGGNVDDIEYCDREISFRGVEKYGNAQVRALKKSKLLIQSVLLRQSEHKLRRGRVAICLKEELAALSKRLSTPCRNLAHLHASKYMDDAKLDETLLELCEWTQDDGEGSCKRRRVCYEVACNETTAREA